MEFEKRKMPCTLELEVKVFVSHEIYKELNCRNGLAQGHHLPRLIQSKSP